MTTATAVRLPQFRDRVEVLKTNAFGEVMKVRRSVVRSAYSFFVLFDDGHSGWYAQAELRVIGFGAASDPVNYQ